MKTILNLSVDDKLIERAKKDSGKENEGFPQTSFLDRIKRYSHPIKLSDEKIEKTKREIHA